MTNQSELISAMREIVRYAVMTLAVLPDPDRKYLGLAKMPVQVIHDVQEAYGYSSAWVRKFTPSPRHIEQMDVVMPWLAWLRREEGEQALRRIMGWAMGAPMWRLGQREGCSDRTILNRIDRSITHIIAQFAGNDLPVEYIEEPYRGAEYAIIFEHPDPTSNNPVKLMRIYVGGKGFWQAGKYQDRGHQKFKATAEWSEV